MSTLLVFAFDSETGAQKMIADVQALQRQQLLTLSDAAIVIRRRDGKVKVKQANNLVGAGALGGAFWGLLIGLLFWTPWLGLEAGATADALAGKVSDCGITDDFIKEVGAIVEPGHSALFLIVAYMVEGKVLAALGQHQARLLRTNLSNEDEARMREAFGVVEMV
ncbi:MAG TPA: DUF1269 domain-containing protein [Chloroflexota bacterium]|nr:DUF1269 domain-containing protein [Chloroflexota bacterium]HUM70798.1 DUF1269 domain-containing protein [Chloroflexota bacterium]